MKNKRWASVNRATAFGEMRGFRVHTIDLREVNGTVMVDLDGYGEVIEVYFKLNKSGYVAYHRTFIHGPVRGGDWLRSWNKTEEYLYSCSTSHN